MIWLIFILAFLFQLVAAILAVQLLRSSKTQRPWIYIASSLAILALLNGVLFFQSVTGQLRPDFDISVAVITLVASVLLAVGMYRASSHVQSITQSEALSSEELERFRVIFDQLPSLIVLKDNDFVYMATNQSFDDFLGKQAEALIGNTDFDFFPRSQAYLFRQEEEIVINSGQSRTHEEEVNGIEGRRWLQITRSPWIGQDGQAAGVLVSAHDITEQKQLETTLRRQSARLDTLQSTILPLFSLSEKSQFLQKVLAEAGKLAGTEHGYIGLVDPQGANLDIQAGFGSLKKLVGMEINAGEDIAGNVWETGQTTIVKDYNQWPKRSEKFLDTRLGAAIGVPLTSGTSVMGAIVLAHDTPGLVFNNQEITLLKRFARIVSLAWQNLLTFEQQTTRLEQSEHTIGAWKQRAHFEHFGASIATKFINLTPQKMDELINQALQTIGHLNNVDRSFLVMFSHEGLAIDAVHEWYAKGINPHSDILKDFHINRFPWWIDKLNRLETIQVSHLSDLPPEANATADFLKTQGIKSYLSVPLISGRSLVGYLGLDTLREERVWHSDTIQLLKTTSEIFMTALDRKRTDEVLAQKTELVNNWISTLEQRNRESTLITEMGDLLQACRTAEEAYPIISRYARHLFKGCSGGLYVFRGTEDPAEQVTFWGDHPPGIAETELALNECWALRRGRVHQMTDPNLGPNCQHVKEPFPQAYLCVPMIAQGEALGLLHLRSNPQDPDPQARMDEYQQLALQIAEHIALALSNLTLRDELRSQAIRDPLTGLFNRRYMEETLKRELRRANRHGTPVGFIFFDVDGLKPINDSYGHDAGDALLKALGELMLVNFRGEDVACRFGGDEFSLILPEASLADTWQRAEELREGFKKIDLEHEGKPIGPTTLSMGVVAFPDHGKTASRLVQAGDAASYLAKAEGGDRVMIGRAAEDNP